MTEIVRERRGSEGLRVTEIVREREEGAKD